MVVDPALAPVTETSFGIEYSVHGAFIHQILKLRIQKIQQLTVVGRRGYSFFFVFQQPFIPFLA